MRAGHWLLTLASLALCGGVFAVDVKNNDFSYVTPGVNTGIVNSWVVGGADGIVSMRQERLLAERKAAREGGDDAMNRDAVKRLWVSPVNTDVTLDEKRGLPGYNYTASGANLGFDRAVGDFVVGGAMTYSSASYDECGADDDNGIDNYGTTLYGQYYDSLRDVFVTAAGGYNYGDNGWKRYNSVADGWVKGDNRTDSWWLGGCVGKDIRVNRAFAIVPSMGLFWAEARNSAYGVSGAEERVIGGAAARSLALPVDVALSYEHSVGKAASVTLKASAGYLYRFAGDPVESGGGGKLNVMPVQAGRNSWDIGGGVSYKVRNFDFNVDYRYDEVAKYDGHRVAASIALGF